MGAAPAIHRRVHYQDVPNQDDDNDDEDEDAVFDDDSTEIDEENHERGTRRHSRGPPSNSNGMMCMLGYILFALVVTAIALVGYRDMEHRSRHGGMLPVDDDDDDFVTPVTKEGYARPSTSKNNSVHYDPSVALQTLNPFDFQEGDTSLVQPPLLPSYQSDDSSNNALGYMMQPNIYNNTLLFVSEGDLYLTTLGNNNSAAMKLTTTVGNVRTPVLNPVYPHYVAYTATYTGRREVYMLDLRKTSSPAMRLTYWDSNMGVSSVVGWKDDGLTLLFAAMSTDVGLPDVRLYHLSLYQDGADGHGRRHLSHSPLRVWQIQPIPLSQAIDGAFDDSNKCLYFTRFSQSSNTIRYVGGTAESLWAWCHEHDTAVPLTTNYRGTDKSPRIVKIKSQFYLFFLSDRVTGNGHEAASMNLWATALPNEQELYNKNSTTREYIQLTQVSCDFDGKSLMEYALDDVTGHIVLRIGADLQIMKNNVIQDKLSGKENHDRRLAKDIQPLDITVFSDFHEHQERLIPVQIPGDVTTVDVYETAFGGTSALLGLRGQLFVIPVMDDVEKMHPFAGAGMNLPPRRYRIAPGTAAGGSVRIQAAKYVPLLMEKDARRLALILATDPKSDTAEHGFYLLETQSDAPQNFVNVSDMPDPFLGGSKNGGSVADGGLGTVNAGSVSLSPCGRRLAWTDRDGRICVMTMPMYQNDTSYTYKVLPQENEQGQPMVGTEADLSWSPGGRYLAIQHEARNQFDIISIADLGNPEEDIQFGRIVQATPDRFNSGNAYWGRTALDFKLKQQQEVLSQLVGKPIEWSDGATVLYFLSDRDLVTDVKSPWGTRQPSPHFPKRFNIYALPLVLDGDQRGPLTTTRGTFGGGGASELWVDNILALQDFLEAAMDKDKTPTRHLLESLEAAENEKEKKKTVDDEKTANEEIIETKKAEEVSNPGPTTEQKKTSPFPQDREINFGSSKDLSFARHAYRLGNIPSGEYKTISQPVDDPSLMVIEALAEKNVIKIFSISDFPSDSTEPMTVELAECALAAFSFTTTREHLVFFFAPGEVMKVVQNSATGLLSLIQDQKVTKDIADTSELALSVWPGLEYQQMYDDAWRLLRDYFYDPGMNGIDWPEMHSRYRSMVKRCAKREELDDVLKQMAAELSALHVFVYGGEYRDPLHGSKLLGFVHETASLGATLVRSAEWKGYVVTSIPERDPDFNLVDGKPKYSPLSNQMLLLTGQRGLEVGDVIVGVNGESVMRVPDIHMLLRGTKGRSVRLEVLRLASGRTESEAGARRSLKNETVTKEVKNESGKEDITVVPEPLITVPISLDDAADLRYDAWEWNTREMAKTLAKEAGFSVGYVHLRSMSGPEDIDAFFRNFFPDFDNEALIMDVRHNRGGNIDSWLLDVLQRKAWMYWQSRTTNITTGGLGWDEQFAFRGHIVVLIDEHTASDGEGFSRGMSELGLGKLIGKRTWGGGIWLSSDNHLVDGGIATAPEVGTYNDKFGWGLGIEQVGVEPDVEVDNDPRMSFDGRDQQLEYAIGYLKQWIKKEPIVMPKNPGPKRDMSIPKEATDSCHA